jgi:hypothetical protein
MYHITYQVSLAPYIYKEECVEPMENVWTITIFIIISYELM